MVNIYAPNDHSERENFYDSLRTWPWQDKETVLTGDFTASNAQHWTCFKVTNQGDQRASNYKNFSGCGRWKTRERSWDLRRKTKNV
ncbi:hypothetical protein PF003_g39846 [Phytophthora fragariae]|nr:hypothetical protein PF003_g39846 [Phytophthora fragariae]